MTQAYIFYRSIPNSDKNNLTLRNSKSEIMSLHDCSHSTPYWIYMLSPYEEPHITKIPIREIFHSNHMINWNPDIFSSADEGIMYAVYCSFGRKNGKWFVKESAEGAKILLKDKMAGKTFAYEISLRQKGESVRREVLEDLMN